MLDVAYKYGYESLEGFSKVFSRFHGSTPKQEKRKGAKLHLFNPLVIKIIMEGGSIMDYRMEHREHQQFITLVRAFPNEISNDDADTSIPDFWTECHERNLIEPMKLLRAEGKKICSVFAPHKPVIRRQMIRTMRYILRTVKVVFCELWVPVKKN